VRPLENSVLLDALFCRDHDAEVGTGTHRVVRLPGTRHPDSERSRADVGPAGDDSRALPQASLLGRHCGDGADHLVRSVDVGVLLRRYADRLGEVDVPTFVLIVVRVEETGVARVDREGARQPQRAVSRGREELVGRGEHGGLVVLQPQRLGFDEPGGDPVAVDAVDRRFAHSLSDLVTLSIGPTVHPDHRPVQRPALRVDRQRHADEPRQRDPGHAVGEATSLRQAAANALHDRSPIVVRFLLRPARLGMEQRMLGGRGGDHLVRLRVEDRRLDVGGTDIDTDAEVSGHERLLLLSVGVDQVLRVR
jgi:hypothetical protein